MTQEQFSRWEEIAIRMAERIYPNATAARKEKILAEVRNYFWWRHFQEDWPKIEDWDGNGDNYFLCDEVDEFFEKHRHYNRKEEIYTGWFFNQVTSCIKAGFDIAVRQSGGGVLGFTAGDIRSLWDGDVPDWVKEQLNPSFDSIPDKEPIWL